MRVNRDSSGARVAIKPHEPVPFLIFGGIDPHAAVIEADGELAVPSQEAPEFLSLLVDEQTPPTPQA